MRNRGVEIFLLPEAVQTPAAVETTPHLQQDLQLTLANQGIPGWVRSLVACG